MDSRWYVFWHRHRIKLASILSIFLIVVATGLIIHFSAISKPQTAVGPRAMPSSIAGFAQDGTVHHVALDASASGDTVGGWVSALTGCSLGLWTTAWVAANHEIRAAIVNGQVGMARPIPSNSLSNVIVGQAGEMQGNYCQQPIFFAVAGETSTRVILDYQFWRRV